VRLSSGRTLSVEAEAVYGLYAVHQWVTPLALRHFGYAVTHRPSGISVWSVDTFASALKVARHLDEAKALPADAIAFEHLMQEAHASKDSPERRMLAKLTAELTQIAPKVVVPGNNLKPAIVS